MPELTKYYDRLTGGVAIVTGAGSQGEGVGTGKATALAFAREGAKVCLVDLHPERAEQTLKQILDEGGEGFIYAGDILEEKVCAAIVEATLARYGRLNILVNNVGVSGGYSEIWDMDEAHWSKVLNANLKSCVLMTKHAMQALIASGSGSLINIASTAALLASGSAYAYGPAKAAVIEFTREMAVKYGRRGVRANSLCPGHILTPHVAGFFDEAAVEIRRKVAPLGVIGDAWDIAHAAIFYASDESRFISGTCLPVDGGVTQTMQLSAHALVND